MAKATKRRGTRHKEDGSGARPTMLEERALTGEEELENGKGVVTGEERKLT